MRVTTRQLTTASIVFGGFFGWLASLDHSEALSNLIGPVAFFWLLRAGAALMILLLVWAWRSNLKQDRRVERSTQFNASIEPEKRVEFQSPSNDPANPLHAE
ncbi:hypothetical protein [Rhizobium tubonense]|uniref:hypothetical protein n=1 Tax=Rhizobium tubonense TaxID=484088 RepID=UPI0011B54DF1|nr:hypothetical protein [Rhizobium tubonense]